MISCDTNVLFAVCNSQAECHQAAWAFIKEHARNTEFCVCEQALVELYGVLRNPVICVPALSAEEAVQRISVFRANPSWRIVDLPGRRSLMDEFWQIVARKDFVRRRIFDLRMALTLRHHGVTEFATRNLKDFQGFGFDRVWDPLAE